MNMTQDPTTADLADVLMRCNDNSGHHILWVDFNGNVHVSQVPDNLTPLGWAESMAGKVKFRYEAFNRGNEYVGSKAANDQTYLEELLKDLKRDWANNATGYIDS